MKRQIAYFLIGLLLSIGLVTSSYALSCLSGFVRDQNGNPVVGGDLDFIDVNNGVKLVTPGDNTGPDGFYSVCILNSGIYHVTFAPPSGSSLLGKRFDSFDLSLSRTFDVVLDQGIAISGTVSDSVGNLIAGVDIDVDYLTGGRLFTPNDKTAILTGAYGIAVPLGDYRIRFDPPPGTRYRGVQFNSVSITADTVIDVVLVSGHLLSGRITDVNGGGLFDIDIDLRDQATGEKIFVSNNSTDTGGYYNVAVPPGLFQLRISPPRGSRYIGMLVDSQLIAGDLVFNPVLSEGIIFGISVQDSLGGPIAGADIDFKLTSTGAKIFTPNDRTMLDGTTAIAVATGLYTIQVDPPLGTSFDRLIVNNVEVTGDSSAVFILPDLPRVSLSGRVVDQAGNGISGAQLDLSFKSSGNGVFIPLNLTDSNGYFDLAAPIGEFEVLISPQRGSRLVAGRIDSLSINADTILTDIVLSSGLIFTGQVIDYLGDPVVGADFDFVFELSGIEPFTPFDNTDVSGEAQIVVLAGLYNIIVTPPAGSGLASQTLFRFDMQSDSSHVFVLQKIGGDGQDGLSFALKQNYPNPFNATTRINYSVLLAGNIKIEIYNGLGQLVKILVNGWHQVNSYQIVWDGTDNDSRDVSSGIYFYRMTSPDGDDTRKMVLLR